ncbi:ABC transporter ATP-binding protein/permease [Aerococcaceae bacterium NML190938]|nr:ABC transporter ATP-binding protein/permease [Aerococcaceae bacterium NML190938]
MSKDTQSEWTRKMSLREQVEVTKRIFCYALPFKKRFLFALLIGTLTSLITAAMPRVIQLYLDRYIQTQSATVQVTLFFIVAYFMLIALQLLTGYLSSFYFKTASEKTVELVRNTLYQKVNGHGMRYFDQTPAGSIVSRITNDTETLKSFWQVFYGLFEGIVSLVAVFIGMYLLNAKMALLFLIFVPIMIGIILLYQSYSSRVYRMMRENLSRLNTKLNESILGMSIIQQFRQEERLMQEFEKDNAAQYRARVAVIQMNALLLNPVINLLEGMALAVILYVLGGQFLQGALEIGLIYAFTQYCANFFRPMGMMMDNLSLLQDGVVSSSRILKVLDHQELVPTQQVDTNAHITQAKIEFRNVSFSYDGEHHVLNDISFTVNPGETVALVGHTGSGKSSIINVLMRFYEFQQGDVLIDGHSIRQFDYHTLRQQMGLVLQDAFLFYGDIARNIRLLDTSINDFTVKKAAQFVNADTFIEQDPAGYRKKVIERGASYSSGQKQLISFARTMARDPKILILDEATANIDTQTEEYIQASLRKMRQGRTTIAIAHRLSTIRDANQILVLDKGRIIERGTHDELIALGGTYYQMYQLQSLG